MNHSISLFICLLFTLTTGSRITAQTGKTIIEKSKLSTECTDQQVTFTLDLVNAKGKKRSQKSVWSHRTDDGDVRYSIFRFLAPADVEGTGFLSIENPTREDDRWLFLPVLGKSRRISSNEKSDRFMGSDFTYEDLERINLSDFDYELTGEEMVDGSACHVIKCTPNNPKTVKESGYSQRIYYILKDNFQYKKLEFYNKKNQMTKSLIANDIKAIAGKNTYRTYNLEMTDLKSKHKSVIQFSDFKIDSGIQEDIFTVRNLEKI